MTTNQPNEMNTRLEQLTILMEDTAEVVLAHDASLTHLENVALTHDAALTRIEAAISELVTATTQNNDRIEQILEYLFREKPNGRGS